jgi:dihydrofolate reductase
VGSLNLKLVAIAAVGENRELGFKNDLIWRIPEDLEFFRRTIAGAQIVMGCKTFESVPATLPAKRYLVMSRTLKTANAPSGALAFASVADFLTYASATRETIFVIGGSEIFSALLPHCAEIILTEIHAAAPADAFFPNFDKSKYTRTPLGEYQHGGIAYERNRYVSGR